MFRRLFSVEREQIDRKVDGWTTKIVGGVFLWIGVVFAGLTVWASYKVSLLHQPENAAAYGIACGFCLIAAFCLLVGWRLFWNRPNRYGSILGPIGWGILCLFFGGAGLFLTFAFGISKLLTDISLAWPVVACFVFSYWCFHLARKALTNVSEAAL